MAFWRSAPLITMPVIFISATSTQVLVPYPYSVLKSICSYDSNDTGLAGEQIQVKVIADQEGIGCSLFLRLVLLHHHFKTYLLVLNLLEPPQKYRHFLKLRMKWCFRVVGFRGVCDIQNQQLRTEGGGHWRCVFVSRRNIPTQIVKDCDMCLEHETIGWRGWMENHERTEPSIRVCYGAGSDVVCDVNDEFLMLLCVQPS